MQTTHPVHAVYDGKFNTATGEIMDILLPSPASIHVEDIAKGLSKICRFGGQISKFYSVAQHSILVTQLAPAELQPYALMHDATEAYIGDIIKPLKVILGDVYARIEERFHSAICERFGFDPHAPEWEAIKRYDHEALSFEHEWLQQGKSPHHAWAIVSQTNAARLLLPSSVEYAWDSLEAEVRFKNMCGFHKIK